MHVLGVPHPPGTPLYVVAGGAFARALPFLPTAVATNLFSAACAAAAAALTALLVGRWTGRTAAGVAAGLCAGSMSSVWASATETEVYCASLLLSVVMLWCADRSTREGGTSGVPAAAYCIGLAVPLHLSALVAAPAAATLAGLRPGTVPWRQALSWTTVATLGGALLVAAGAGTLAWAPAAAGIALLGASAVPKRHGGDLPRVAAVAAVLAIALTALLIMLVRARHDPAINQGDPSTMTALLDVIGRRQYDVPPWVPRQAPLWLQLGNLLEYADWQIALGLTPGVAPSAMRTPWTIVFLALAVAGSVAHRRADRRSWRALMVLLVSATVGVVLYLNLKASPSFGAGLLPAGAPREARERDYFFLLAFWCWGVWAGIGAVAVASAIGKSTEPRAWRAWLGVALAALPIALNWTAVNRRREPVASLARAYGISLLTSAPANAVLFVEGDNDTYPLWYLQQVEALRRDVTVVTISLLPAQWYRAELARRAALVDATVATQWYGDAATVAAIAARAGQLGRPVATAIGVLASERAWISRSWTLAGLVYRETRDGDMPLWPGMSVDTVATAAAADRARDLLPVEAMRPPARFAIDPTPHYTRRLMACPDAALAALNGRARGSLDSVCNFR